MKRNITPYIYIIFFLFNTQNIISQNFILKAVTSDSLNNSFLQSISFQKNHKTKQTLYIEIDSISKRLSNIGFIDNKVSFIKEKDSITTSYFNLGQIYQSISLTYNSKHLDKELLNRLNIRHDGTYIYTLTKSIPKLLNNIVGELENKGNSFSKVSLKNISKMDNRLIADIIIEKSPNRTIDKIVVKGYENFPKTYIKHFLKLKEGSHFNSDKLRKASNSLQSINFANELKYPEILFEQDSTTIYLYLQKTKTNKFDGLIGFNTNEEGKLQFNGYLDLHLNNLLNKGESLAVNWKSNGQDRKSFNLNLKIPYVFKTPFSIGGMLNIHKQDSSFLNTKAIFDLSYQINANQLFSGNLQSESSNEISQLNSSSEEFTNLFYGVTYNFHKPEPLRLYENKINLSMHGFWGNRTTTSNNTSEKQSKYLLNIGYNWTLNKKHSILAKSQNAILLSKSYYENELYRIGGARTIRGFNEESLFSSAYSIFNLEYHYYLNNISKIYSISDFAFIQNKITSQETQLFGFGLGYTYQTKNGIIDISYALGKYSNIPIEFKNSIFHIKFIQLF